MTKERNTLIFPDTFKVSCYIQSPKDYDISDLIKIVGNKILGYNEAHIIVQHNDKILDKFSPPDCEIQALLDKTLVPHTYNLMLRTKLQGCLEYVICHEMQHFDQYERGDLNIKKDEYSVTFTYKGKNYSSSIDYYARPWEREARSAQYKLWKEFKKLYYKK